MGRKPKTAEPQPEPVAVVTVTDPHADELRAQCEAAGIVLSDACQEQDFEAALDAYARGWQRGAETAYHAGIKDAGGLEDPDPTTWDESVARFGHAASRQKFPAMYDDMRRRERETRKRRQGA